MCSILFIVPQAAFAAARLRSSNNVTIDSGETINDDLYVSGGTVVVNCKVNGDLIVAGGTVTINGPVRDDLLIAGGTIEAASSASIGRDALLASGNAQLSGAIGRKLQAAGGGVVIDGPVGGTARLDVNQSRFSRHISSASYCSRCSR